MEWLQTGFGLMIGFIGLFDTARDYNLQFTVMHIHTIVHSRVFTSLMVTASNGGRSPSSGFPNCPRSQLPASNSNPWQRLYRSSPVTNSPPTNSQTNSLNCTALSESKLLYDWRFTANQFVWASSPLRPTTLSLMGLVITYRHGPHRKHRSSFL
jgi:hypothetical protein